VNALRQNASLVESLGSALRSGDHGLTTVPPLLKRVLVEESWRCFLTQRGDLVEYDRFADFVVTPPLKGIGGTVELVKRIVASDPETADLLDRELQRAPGRPESVDIVNEKRPTGNARDAALRRLRKDAPELHAEVLAGHLTAHAAMVKAGFRHRTISVPVDQPVSAADALRKHMSADDLRELVLLLAD
jgi:hypothetical protein